MLTKVAITGPDDAVDIADLNAISAEFPYVEWALLCEPEAAGTARAPSFEWIDAFMREARGHRAVHMCTSALIGLSKGEEKFRRIVEGFDRIQLNFKYRETGSRLNLDGLVAQVKSFADKTFIFQYGGEYVKLLPAFEGCENMAVLFDGSAGSGALPDSWPAPLPGFACGYAGGLGPDNIVAQVEKIKSVLPPGYETWVDMESGVRTNDVFDLTKVCRVLEAAAPYIFQGRKDNEPHSVKKGPGRHA